MIVLMGPAGSGKSTAGAALASRLGWTFVDADDHHSPDNVSRMARGEPLDDERRAEWLDALHAVLRAAVARRAQLVMACSALSREHRARLRGDLREIRFVYLRTPREVLRERLASRRGHFAGPALLEDQLAMLQEPEADEPAITVDGTADVDTIAGHVRLEFGV
ncbi:MAG: gluconokinase [Vicinamibacterales bacterium]